MTYGGAATLLSRMNPQHMLSSAASGNSYGGLQVAPIVDAVRQQGDEAVRTYTKQFDRADLQAVCLPIQVSPAEDDVFPV